LGGGGREVRVRVRVALIFSISKIDLPTPFFGGMPRPAMMSAERCVSIGTALEYGVLPMPRRTILRKG
jgi:hypothetical protein